MFKLIDYNKTKNISLSLPCFIKIILKNTKIYKFQCKISNNKKSNFKFPHVLLQQANARLTLQKQILKMF